MNKNALISLSGGMDSTSLLLKLLVEYENVYAISFDYGQKHLIELDRAMLNIVYLKAHGYDITYNSIDISAISTLLDSSLLNKDVEVPEGHYENSNMKSTVVPNRNAIFSSIMFAYALSIANKKQQNVDICLGIHAGDHQIYPDCRQEFRDQIEKAFKIGNWDSERVNYYTPYINYDKTKILQDALINIDILYLDFDIIFANTITSYNPDELGRSSGKSGSDIERIEAFININRKDPVEYIEDWNIVKANTLKILQKKL